MPRQMPGSPTHRDENPGLGGCPPNPPSGSAAPVLTPRRPLSFRQVSKDFKDFVTAIGECKSKQEEDRIIMKEM
jgi:hypothetical protein